MSEYVPGEDVTLGELYRLVLRVQSRLDSMQADIAANMVPRDLYVTAQKDLERRVVDLEKTNVRDRERRSSQTIVLISVAMGNVGAIIAAIIANLRIH